MSPMPINAPIGRLKVWGFPLGPSSEFSRRPSIIIRRLTGKKEGAGVMFGNGQLQGAVSYTILSAIAAFCVVCLPVSAENSLTKLNVTSTPLISVSDVAWIQKADRLSGILFEERWNAVPAPLTGTRNEQKQRETPWA